jgi:hypothetical protein
MHRASERICFHTESFERFHICINLSTSHHQQSIQALVSSTRVPSVESVDDARNQSNDVVAANEASGVIKSFRVKLRVRRLTTKPPEMRVIDEKRDDRSPEDKGVF